VTIMHAMAADFHADTLAEIYQPDVNIAIWQRSLSSGITRYAKHLMSVSPNWQTRFIQHKQKIAQQLEHELPLSDSRPAFIDDIVQVVDMFSCLFELDHVGLRMAVLSTAMCPKFHVDRIPCRLICTYDGATTQWHPSENVERLENGGVKPWPGTTPKSLNLGDVALLKGEGWEGNEGGGLVHCSPHASKEAPRLVLTLDFA
jgi:hypothetical protein